MKQFEIVGISASPSIMKLRRKKLIVGVSNDKLGKSLSIYDESKDVLMEIPMEGILKYFEDGAE